MTDFENLESNGKPTCSETVGAEMCIFPSCLLCQKHIIFQGKLKLSYLL